MNRSRRLARRVLVALAAASGIVTSCQTISVLGPDFELWFDAGRPDPSIWEQWATAELRLRTPPTFPSVAGHQYSAGEFLRMSADAEIQDGDINMTFTRTFVEEPIDFKRDFISNNLRLPASLPAILFVIATTALVFQGLARARREASSRAHPSRSHSDEPRARTIHFRSCASFGWTVAVGILLAASVCLLSLTGWGSSGTISISTERPSNNLHEMPPGVVENGAPIDLRLEWRFADGGLCARAALVRAYPLFGHVSYVDPPEPKVGFLAFPRIARHSAYLASRFVADGYALQLGGWVPTALAGLIIVGIVLVRRRRRLIDLRGLCPACEYDLTGNTTGICPEFGARAARQMTQRSTSLRRALRLTGTALNALILAAVLASIFCSIGYTTSAGNCIALSSGAIQYSTNSLTNWGGFMFGPPAPAIAWIFALSPTQISSIGLFGSARLWTFPLWIPFVCIGIPTALLWWSDSSRTPPNCCEKCEYDLTGNTSGTCPECGQPAERPT